MEIPPRLQAAALPAPPEPMRPVQSSGVYRSAVATLLSVARLPPYRVRRVSWHLAPGGGLVRLTNAAFNNAVV
jgi:hypothetical protein